MVIIGFNSSDNPKIAKDLILDKGLTYPNIVNSSSLAQEVQFYIYQTSSTGSAVPLNYLIDRDGKIADAWYGFDKSNTEEITKKVESLLK